MSDNPGNPGTTATAKIGKAIKAIKARIHALDDRDRELTIALLTGRDADMTPGPGPSDARFPARLQQRSAPMRPASLHVRRLCLARPTSIPAIPAVTVSGT